MNRVLFAAAFTLGAGAVLWMGTEFLGSDRLALAVTVVIAAAYGIGFLELMQFRRASASLATALQAIPADTQVAADGLAAWLDKLHPSLRDAVRLRIEGDRFALPAPVLTPYLVGLLVMLGLLGTFVGMVVTLKGAVLALEGTTELQAIRAGLAAPIQGLSLAFGTSVAGVAASAMLGLASTLSRRERLLITRRLDRSIAAAFREFSLDHNRRETYRALQQQARVLPEVAATLQTLAHKLEHMSDRLEDTLVANQTEFHQSAQRSYRDLADSVGRSLKDSLSESGRLAGAGIGPAVSQAMDAISREAERTLLQVSETARGQLDTFSAQFTTTADLVSRAWQEGLASHRRANGEHLDNLVATLAAELSTLRSEEAQRGGAAVERLADLEKAVAAHLSDLGQKLEEPMRRLIESAAETPRAAAEVIAQLRAEISNNIARDNSLLAEREQTLENLHTLSRSLEQSSCDQREALAELVGNATETLGQTVLAFRQQLEVGVSTLDSVADRVTSNAVEMSSLGEAFNCAVTLFDESNRGLVAALEHIQEALQESTERSDEQMGYYVAQAREIIDQSLLSQQEILARMDNIDVRAEPVAAGAG